MTALKLQHDSWVVVADGEKALFLRNEGDAKFPNLEVFRHIHEENPPTRNQGTDRPGRMNDGAGGAHRSAVQETDWHRVEKERFAKDIAERLYKAAHRGDYQRLVIVAPPLVMGEMRKEMHKEVTDRVVAEIPKTLTNHTIDEIERLLTTE
jgi:protein required for attachment to host cells